MVDLSYNFDPEFRQALACLPTWRLDDLGGARRALAAAAAADADCDAGGLIFSDRRIAGPASEQGVQVRLYQPCPFADDRPAILHMHGGGFVMGSVGNSHRRCVRLARELDAVVLSVEYRLAPENPYPAALEDVLSALHWLDANAGGLGVDRSRMAIHGVSAGAALAAATALFVRDHGGPRLCHQFLAIPALDDRLETPSMVRFTDTPTWDRLKAETSWSAYLGTGREEVPPYAAPARAADLREVPPAYISAMEFDPLRDEAIDFARALLSSGVSVELHVFPGTYHGSTSVSAAHVSKRETDEELEVLRRVFRRSR